MVWLGTGKRDSGEHRIGVWPRDASVGSWVQFPIGLASRPFQHLYEKCLEKQNLGEGVSDNEEQGENAVPPNINWNQLSSLNQPDECNLKEDQNNDNSLIPSQAITHPRARCLNQLTCSLMTCIRNRCRYGLKAAAKRYDSTANVGALCCHIIYQC